MQTVSPPLFLDGSSWPPGPSGRLRALENTSSAPSRRHPVRTSCGAFTVLAPAGKQYDVCLFGMPGRAEEQSPHVPRKTGNVLTAAWPIAINVMVACRPTSGTTSSLPEKSSGIHRHLGPRRDARLSIVSFTAPCRSGGNAPSATRMPNRWLDEISRKKRNSISE